MVRYKKVHNERSETIELIKWMDSIVKQNTWQIKLVGGESTLNTGNQRMFPDVFLYGDNERTQILQGWEVKMPDVAITDSEFIRDAQRKADVLGVNSCVVWNFTCGVLYVKESDNWVVKHRWDNPSRICTRADVVTHKNDWENQIIIILKALNEFFLSGELRSAGIGEIIADTIFAELIKRNKAITAEYIQKASVKNTVIDAYISQWWRTVKQEYNFDENNKFSAYAKYILMNWINKFTFANIIKINHNPAKIVETININMTPKNALTLFKDITEKCDFLNVFETVQFSEVISKQTWTDLIDYNALLKESGLVQIPQTTLQSVLEKSVHQFKRNSTGQFTTPKKLAEILVGAGILDLTASAIDPCCGTGTIVKEILAAKESAVGIERALATTFASDKSPFALQIANIAMTRASAINLPSLLFRLNVFDMQEGKKISITNPQNGKPLQYKLPKWGAIVSNLPFVAFDQEGREEKEK